VSYCINPKCLERHNPDHLETCQACGTPLLVRDRYRLIEPLRQLDGYSHTEIFLVEDKDILKVLKVLNPQLTHMFGSEARTSLTQMFEREARTLQQLKHPGIPQVDSDGYFTVTLNWGKIHCLVMEKIEGQNLEQWLEKHGTISQELALKWLRQLTEILSKVHQSELFHRDIKLSNIMLRPDGQLVLIDFGSVRKVTNTYLAKIGGGRDITGIISPGYTPLEQINGKAVPQSDFYALGRSLVYLLTGKHPIDLPENDETGKLNWRDNATQVSGWLADLIDDLMAPFPGQRPLNTKEILARLDKPKMRSPRLSWNWLVVLNLCLLGINVVVGGLWFAQFRQQQQPTINQETRSQDLTSFRH
jgi:serine/threonine protein kinase